MSFIVDANVYNKLFLAEPDSPDAFSFFRHLISGSLPWFEPPILQFEMLHSALHYSQPFAIPLGILDNHLATGMAFIEPWREVWLVAEEISQTGHAKSGYPSLADSLYHALAIQMEGTFVTADRRHYTKAESFGHICMLPDALVLFQET